MSLAFTEHDAAVWQGDALEQLTLMPAGSVQCAVTSPPYFGLRDYGTGRWEGGAEDCDHSTARLQNEISGKSGLDGGKGAVGRGTRNACICGAHRVDEQLGLESSPPEYVARMVAVFAEVRRVLAADGVLWLNLGDSYNSGGNGYTQGGRGETAKLNGAGRRNLQGRIGTSAVGPKNLLGMPWRVAFALQDDDSGDIYELRVDAPDSVRQAEYLETCRIRTPKLDGNITASTPADGAKPTRSNTEPDVQSGSRPTATSSAVTAESTTSCTASKRSSEPSVATPVDTDDSGSRRCNGTAARTPSVSAAGNAASTSSASTTSTEAARSTDANCEQPTSRSGNSCAERVIPKDSESSATTATVPVATTARVRTKPNALPRLRKADIPPLDIEHFRLVKQDRWILRNCVVWAKPNAMPESVTDRLSTRYELVFLFSKSRRYWFDLDPIRETIAYPGKSRSIGVFQFSGGHAGLLSDGHPNGRNPGDVWSIPTSAFPGAHFACMPPALAERCIKAGCPPGGTVLDPFAGSGTTLAAARKLGRKSVGIELNPDYIDLIRARIGQAPLDFETAASPVVAPCVVQDGLDLGDGWPA